MSDHDDAVEQSRLSVGDTRKPILIKDRKRVTTGDLAALAMCAHRFEPGDVMGWHTHAFDDVVREWVIQNVGSVICRLSPHCEQRRGELPPLHPSDDLWVGPTETGPTQTTLVTDGGVEQPDPRPAEDLLAVEYLTVDELRKLHPGSKPLPVESELNDAECHNCGEPWADGDQWDERKIPSGPSLGESWVYQCPNCGFETFECGT